MTHCHICDEVTALTSYGWDPRTILDALDANPKALLRHLRGVGPPVADKFTALATETRRQRRAPR